MMCLRVSIREVRWGGERTERFDLFLAHYFLGGFAFAHIDN